LGKYELSHVLDAENDIVEVNFVAATCHRKRRLDPFLRPTGDES
jgi:hypothetical protein